MLHAILRLVLLGLNVLDSFKIIKPPKVRNGQPGPSARALTARKRAMKGMMCVWVVSACWLYLERICDRTVIYLMPFYDEIKTMCLLFMIFTRSSGAEPIVVKYLAPLIKPYVKPVDSILELLSMVSAFALELASVPIKAVDERWQAFSAEDIQGDDGVTRRARGFIERRFTVFSFWRDNDEPPLVLDATPIEEERRAGDWTPSSERDAPEEAPTGYVVATEIEPSRKPSQERRTISSGSSSRGEKPLPPPPSSKPKLYLAPSASRVGSSAPRLGQVTATIPTVQRYPSQQSHRAEIVHAGARAINADDARDAVRQAQEIYDDLDAAQEDVRHQRERSLKTQQTSRKGQQTQSSGSSSTRPAPRPGYGRGHSSSSSGTHKRPSSVSAGEVQSVPKPVPILQTSPPGTSYVPAPPPEGVHGQSPSGDNASWGYQRNPSVSHSQSPPFPGHMSPPPSAPPFGEARPTSLSYASAMSMLPPQDPAPAVSFANINVDAYFNPSDPYQRARRRPPPIPVQPVRLSSNPNIAADQDSDEDDIDADAEADRPATPPSQYLGPLPSSRTLDDVPGPPVLGMALPTPMAPGGFGGQWEESDDDEVGPDDSISVRGAPRHVVLPMVQDMFFLRNQTQRPEVKPAQPRPRPSTSPLGRPKKGFTIRGGIETRPTTVNDFEQLRLAVEAEEAEEAEEEDRRAGNEAEDDELTPEPTPAPRQRRSHRISTHLPGHFPVTPGFQTQTGSAGVHDATNGQERGGKSKVHPRSTDARPALALDLASSGGLEPDGNSPDAGDDEETQTNDGEEPAAPADGPASKADIARLKEVIEEALGGKQPLQLPNQPFSAPISRKRPGTAGDSANGESARRLRPKALQIKTDSIGSNSTGGAKSGKRDLQTIEESVSISLGQSMRGEEAARSSTDERSIPAVATAARPAVRSKPQQPAQVQGSSHTATYSRLTRQGGNQTGSAAKESQRAPAAVSSGGSVAKVPKSKSIVSQKRSSSSMDEDPKTSQQADLGRRPPAEHDPTKKRRVASASEARQSQDSAIAMTRISAKQPRTVDRTVGSGSSSTAGVPPAPLVLNGGRYMKSTPDSVIPDVEADELGQALPKPRRRVANATR